jgi:hypothetical protein
MKTKPDIVMDQKALIQQLLGKMPENGNQINIIQIGEITQVGTQGEQGLEAFLESLPEPRLRNLIEMAKQVAMKKFSRTVAAAAWLGVSRRTLDNVPFVEESYDGIEDKQTNLA